MRKEKGSVTIEASIALTAFVFLFFVLYTIITVSRAQAKLQIAIDSVAKELSQYSYLYALSGMHTSISGVQQSAQQTAGEINNSVSGVISVFNGIQSLGSSASSVDVTDAESVLNSWGDISTQLNNTTTSVNNLRADIERIASNPQDMLLGMARLFASNTLDIAKSKLIADPVSRLMVKKHLKRSANDTPDAFLKSLWIKPDSSGSYMNGLDFSDSLLFPYGTDEILIAVKYTVVIPKLLPFDLKFEFSLTASTLGWLYGDAEPTNTVADHFQSGEHTDSIWNSPDWDTVRRYVRDLGLRELKDAGFYQVSGNSSVQAYNPDTNTFAFIAPHNALYGHASLSEIDEGALAEDLLNLAGRMSAATDNVSGIDIKVDGGTRHIDIASGQATNIVVQVVIPEDPGLADIYRRAAATVNSQYPNVKFEMIASFGTYIAPAPAQGEP